MEKKHEVIDGIIEYGIYLYIIFMFLTKGEGIRSILIFGNFALWLSTLKYRKNLYILKEPVSRFFWIYTGITVFFVFFSVDPLYSIMAFREDIVKAVLLFPVIATVMSDRKRLERVIYAVFFTALLVVLNGYYSYFFHDIPFLRGDTALMHTGHTGHSRFARYLNTLLPFMFVLYFTLDKRRVLKALFVVSFIISIFALVLTTSREGYVAFVSMVFIWAVFFSRKKGYSLVKVVSGITAVILIVAALSWSSFPAVRERVSRTVEELPTMNLRTHAWIPALYAIRERPVLGWGYGSRIFDQDEPYKDTPYKKAPPKYEGSPKGIHNTFIKVMFHQGITGAVPYLLLVLISIQVFWKGALRATDINSYILISCVAVLAGNYILNSLLSDLRLHYMAVILGLGMAARAMPAVTRD